MLLFINEMKGATLPEITEREFCHPDVLEAAWLRQPSPPVRGSPALDRGMILVLVGIPAGAGSTNSPLCRQAVCATDISVNILQGYSWAHSSFQDCV